MPAQIYQEAPGDVFNPIANPTDWLELIDGNGQSPSESHFNADSQTSTLVGYIPWNKQRSARQWFLAYAYTDDNYVLHRENPVSHPLFPELFCDGISFKAFVPAVNEETGNLKFTSPFFGSGIGETANIQYVANHKYVIAIATFRSFMTPFLADSAITVPSQEFYRNNYLALDPDIEILSADGVSQLTFAEGGPGGKGPTATKSAFPAPVGQRLQKAKFAMNWTNLPMDFLSTTDSYFYPANILSIIGKISSAGFPAAAAEDDQFPAGTLYCPGAKFTQRPFPITPADITYPIISIDVTLELSYFNPPQGASSPLAAGHLTFPFRGAPGDPTGGKFFYATRGGGASDPPVLPTADFNNIFVSPNAP
jgi:hypothetical protein